MRGRASACRAHARGRGGGKSQPRGASIAAIFVSYSKDLDYTYLAIVIPLVIVLYFTFSTSMGRVEDALAAFRRAAELAPNNAQVQYALGLTLKDKGDAAGAQAAMNRAARLEHQSK